VKNERKKKKGENKRKTTPAIEVAHGLGQSP